MALSNELSRALDWRFSRGAVESGKSLCLSQGKLSPTLSNLACQGRFMGHMQGPSCPCLAVEPSVSLQTKPARCSTLYYHIDNKTSNLIDGTIFSHMLQFFKYFFVLSLFLHSSHTFDLQLPLKSVLISHNTFMTSGLKGPNWHFIPFSQASTSLLPSCHDTGLSPGSGPTKRPVVSSSSSHN